MATFTFTIRSSAKLGDTKEAERAIICQLLDDAKQIIGSHRDPQPLMYNGAIVGEYEFGANALNNNFSHATAYR
jgi:hypothetical protein